MKAVMAQMPKHWLEERKNSDVSQWDEVWNGVLHMPPMPSGMHQDFEYDLTSFLKRKWAKPLGALVRHGVNLTTPEDEPAWTKNYRVPDIVMVSRDRLAIDKDAYMAGAPLVVIEIRSPDDESYEKLPFYAALGVPEVWIFDRDTKKLDLFVLNDSAGYTLLPPDADGWQRSPASGVEFLQTQPGSIRLRVDGNDSTAEELPN